MMDYRIEVITVPVRDVDLAVQFYTKRAGFILDVDYRLNSRKFRKFFRASGPRLFQKTKEE